MFRRSFYHSFFMTVFLVLTMQTKVTMAKIYINVSVDWEGREVSEQNIKAMESFRRKFPHIPLLHFLNAAYFTKKNADPEKLKKQINRVVNKDDEHGLHIHSWKSLIKKSGVEYRSEPSWNDWRGGDEDCSGECGHSVPLWAYTEKELRKVIRFSLDTLERYGFRRAKSFRAGGWMTSKKVFDALSLEGITLDASAVPKVFLASSQPTITSWIGRLWPRIKKTSQPYFVSARGGQVLEFPNNACLADYMKGSMMLAVLKDHAKIWHQNPDKDLFLSVGFHQETASHYLPQLERGLKLMEMYADSLKMPLAYTVNPLRVL